MIFANFLPIKLKELVQKAVIRMGSSGFYIHYSLVYLIHGVVKTPSLYLAERINF